MFNRYTLFIVIESADGSYFQFSTKKYWTRKGAQRDARIVNTWNANGLGSSVKVFTGVLHPNGGWI